MISIIVPYFKSKHYIDKCVESVFNQNYKNFELIIIDDEHSKESKKKLTYIKKKNKKVKLLRTRFPKSGVAIARNEGIKKSKGEFIAFLDSDDYWKKDKLQKQIKLMNKLSLDFSYTFYKDFSAEGVIRKIRSNNYTYDDLIKRCNIGTSSVVLRKKLKVKFQRLRTKEDYCLWLELFKKKINIGCVNKYLMFHRLRRGSLSDQELNKIVSAYKIYRVYNNFNIFFSIYCVLRLYKNAFIKKYF